MRTGFYEYKEIITQNLIVFIRLRGYSKLSLSKQTGLSRLTIDHILNGEITNPSVYNSNIEKIIQTFDLPNDYFLINQNDQISFAPKTYSQQSLTVQELFDGLDNVMDIFSMYLK
ncbi:helix-turn-helix transcriptional regulator [Paenibacillus jamilae]|uniref:helix-turn-helix domain-containing protein n=1 Tax=Paenibacillus jamilae TaxID=114136 RepID=UPI003D2D81D3